MKQTLLDFCSFLRDYNLDANGNEEKLIQEFLSEHEHYDEYTEQVKQFHEKFKHPVLYTPEIPDQKRCELRISLIQEELNELKQAIKDNDIIEIADALSDIQYVLSGTYLEFGVAHIMPKLFAEVQRSNMSKACANEQQAIDTVEYYKNERDTKAYYEQQKDGTFLVYRQGDNKTLKNIYYSPADLKKILENG